LSVHHNYADIRSARPELPSDLVIICRTAVANHTLLAIITVFGGLAGPRPAFSLLATVAGEKKSRAVAVGVSSKPRYSRRHTMPKFTRLSSCEALR